MNQLLVPIADEIEFLTGNGESIVISWDVAYRTVAERLSPTGHYPARYFVASFPTSRELAEMVAASPGTPHVREGVGHRDL